MLSALSLAFLCAVGAGVGPVALAEAPPPRSVDCVRDQRPGDFPYNITLKDILEKDAIPLSRFRGHVVLVVNVATYWGFTYTYPQLNALQARYHCKNFTVLGFPCNQFGKQEPGSGQEVLNGIRYVRPGKDYVPNFPMFQKIEVNGENEHPLFTFLKGRCPSPNPAFRAKDRLFYSPQHNDDVRWNFEKFLLDREGVPVKRYEPSFPPREIARDIDLLTRSKALGSGQEVLDTKS